MNFAAVKKFPKKHINHSSKSAARDARRKAAAANAAMTNAQTSAYRDDSVRIYTDGACSSNGRAGAIAGWGVHFPDGEIPDICGRLEGPTQTNQRAELTALNEALKAALSLAANVTVEIYTDSEYSINCLTKWIVSWKRNGWMNAKRESSSHH